MASSTCTVQGMTCDHCADSVAAEVTSAAQGIGVSRPENGYVVAALSAANCHVGLSGCHRPRPMLDQAAARHAIAP